MVVSDADGRIFSQTVRSVPREEAERLGDLHRQRHRSEFQQRVRFRTMWFANQFVWTLS